MAVSARKTSKPASRLRRLAASAVAAPAILVALAPIGVLAAGTVVIDSRGAYSVEERAAFGGALIDDQPGDAVTLNFSVLDRLADARPRPSRGGSFEANKTFGLGLMIGAPSGLSGKYFLSKDTALTSRRTN